MQSAMAKQMDSQRRGYEAKIEDLLVQLKANGEELAKAKSEAITLTESLSRVTEELRKTASALDEKTSALETLNAGVNTPAEELPTLREGLDRCNSPSERLEFLRSGRYRWIPSNH